MNEFKQSGFGAVLRQRREELGLSLNDLAASTRVRKTYLQALEEENLPMLPGAAYAIGFLRIYARQLGLPVEPLLAALSGDRTMDDHAALPALGGDLPRGARKVGRQRKLGRLLLVLLLVLVAAGYLYGIKFTQGLRPMTAPVAPSEGSPPVQSAPKPAVEPPVAVPSPSAPPAAQGQPAVVPAELSVIPAAGAVVRMLPVAAGTMKVSLDNQEVREYQLQPDQALNWKVSATLAVELSSPGLVRVWVDQQEITLAEQAAFILKSSPKPQGPP